MTVTKVRGVKKFRKGMILKATYMWTGEPTRTYYYRVVEPVYGGEGANVKIFKVVKNGKTEKMDKDSFLWNYETQIGKVRPSDGKGWGRTVLVS